MDTVFNLGKDDIFSLSKSSLSQEMYLGCSWQNRSSRSTDIDLSAIMLDGLGGSSTICSYKNAGEWVGGRSMFHYGDDMSGDDAKTDADNEQIRICLNEVPANITHIFVVASLYSGSMSNLKSCNVSIRKSRSGPKEVDACMSNLTEGGMILAMIIRNDNGWVIERLSVPHSGKVAFDFVTKCKRIMNGDFSKPVIIGSEAGFLKRLAMRILKAINGGH